MKKNTLLIVLLVLVLSAILPTAAFAAPATAPSLQADTPAVPSLPDLVETARNLGGIALLFAAITNLGKRFKPEWFPNGSAPTYSLVFQTLTLVGLVALQLTGRADLVPVIDQSAGTIANILTSFLALAFQLWAGRRGHEDVLAGIPGIGYSHSGRTAGTGISIFETTDPEVKIS